MFENLEDFLQGEATNLLVDSTGQPTPYELQLATVILLFNAAGADKVIAPEEAQALCAGIGKEFALEQSQIPELVRAALTARKNTAKIDQLIQQIRECFDQQQRILILSMVWKILHADGRVDANEKVHAEELRQQLALSEAEACEAEKIAAKDYELV